MEYQSPAGVSWVSLQYGEVAAEVAALQADYGVRLTHWQEILDHYDDTAALVGALDLVVTVCTAMVHLSGGLGQPVWVLVPARAEWRYGMRGESMPWYPSARLFRQDAGEDWKPVVARVACAVDRWRTPIDSGVALLT
jgi:hypothetical protein